MCIILAIACHAQKRRACIGAVASNTARRTQSNLPACRPPRRKPLADSLVHAVLHSLQLAGSPPSPETCGMCGMWDLLRGR